MRRNDLNRDLKEMRGAAKWLSEEEHCRQRNAKALCREGSGAVKEQQGGQYDGSGV